MPSAMKSETARINGAKSRGPVTPEGKARSADNSRRHGLTAASIVLPGESAADFQLLLADYMDQFQPQTAVEAELVEVMAAARWRLRRLLAIEAHQFDLEMTRRKRTGLDHEDRLADAFQKLSDTGNTLALLLRYEATINRSYDKALKQLQQLQSTRPVGSFRNPLYRAVSPVEPKGRHSDFRAATIGSRSAPWLSQDSRRRGHANDSAGPALQSGRTMPAQYSGFSPLAGIEVGTPGVPAYVISSTVGSSPDSPRWMSSTDSPTASP